MASTTVAAGKIGAHNITLSASTVDTVTFTDDVSSVEVINLDGAAAIYYTIDGSTPTVAGANTFVLPATISSAVHGTPGSAATVVKLISSGTPKYSVQQS